MTIQQPSILVEFYDRLDDVAPGDPVDLLADDFEFDMCFPGTETIPVERFSGRSKEDFKQVLRDLDKQGPRFRKSETVRRHNIKSVTITDGVEFMVGEGRGGRRNGSLVGAAQTDDQGKLRWYTVVMTPVAFPEGAGHPAAPGDPGVIARFFDLLDGAVDGDPVDILSEDAEFELTFPGYQGPPDDRIYGDKEAFRQFMESLYAQGHNRQTAATERRHNIQIVTAVDGVEFMLGRAIGGRRRGTILAAAQQDAAGQLRKYACVMSSVAFPAGERR